MALFVAATGQGSAMVSALFVAATSQGSAMVSALFVAATARCLCVALLFVAATEPGVDSELRIPNKLVIAGESLLAVHGRKSTIGGRLASPSGA